MEGYRLIAIDWGTSNFRAFRLNGSGEILERRLFPSRHSSRRRWTLCGNFACARRRLAEGGENRILLCGMVGSREGWAEAKYLSCPVGIADLADSVVELPFSGAEVLLDPRCCGKRPLWCARSDARRRDGSHGHVGLTPWRSTRVPARNALQVDPARRSHHRDVSTLS